jgi:hypothetical protein
MSAKISQSAFNTGEEYLPFCSTVANHESPMLMAPSSSSKADMVTPFNTGNIVLFKHFDHVRLCLTPHGLL